MRLTFALLFACLGAGAHAQADAEALWISAGASVPAAGSFEGWSAGPAAAGRLEAPFYGGRARVSLRASAYASSDAEARPDFTFVTATVGWTRSLDLGRASVGAGALVGATQFRFGEDERFSGNLTNEAEAVVGALARVDVPVAGRVALWAEAEALRVALASPRTIGLVSAGLSLRLDAPRWVQAVLR